jgi:two-component system, OmpR family, KDP operon response regulator KdpE
MNQSLVLVIDDDPNIRLFVRSNLEKRGYRVKEAANGSSAIALMEADFPDLVILDLVMPGMSGNDLCVWIRERWDIPVIVMSARNEEDQKVRALDAGADDYVTKPFGQEEFMARVRAVMRRVSVVSSQPSPDEKIQVNGLTIHLKARRAFVGESDIRLTRTEFALLSELAQHLDAVLTHDELLARVWGDEYRGSSHYLHVYFGRIRKKIGEQNSTLLESVPGVGYILHSTAQS